MHRLTLNTKLSSIPLRAQQQLVHKKYHSNKYRHQQYNYNRKNSDIPPEFLEAGFGKLVLLFTPLAVVGGTLGYAKYDRDFRKLLEQNVPGAERLMKVAFREEDMFPGVSKTIDEAKHKIDSVAKSIESATSSVTGLFGSSSSEKKPQVDAELPFMKNNKIIKEPQTVSETKTVVTKPPATKEPPSKPVVTVARETPLPKDITELEKEIEISAALAVKEYNKAIEILKNFNEDVRQVVDNAVENADIFSWNTLKNKTSARDSAVSTAEKLALEAIKKIEKCELALSKVVEPANQDKVLSVRKKIKNFEDHIKQSKEELYRNKDLATISEKYWRNVEKARNYFVEEIESLFPGLNLSEKQLNLSKDDLDLFVLHAYSHVLTLQKELQRLQTDGELRLKRAIEVSRGENDDEANKAQLEYLLEAEKRRLAVENQKKIFQIKAETAKELRTALKQQAEAHMDHMHDALQMKEHELKRNYNRELEEKLSAERGNYKLQLAAMLGKLRGMDAALQARAESERSAHQAQALWAACQALWSVVRTGEPGVDWRNKLKPLKHEINAISKVAEGDELVAVVLQNMPREAQERGVFPEDALRERFFNVERIARKLALVPEEGASIPMYILSFFQSLFIMKPEEPVSKEELQDQPFDFSKLDTYDILNRARYFVDHGDLMQALKYMNLLQGAPRKVASDWLKEARLLLETQQAANTLMAHAAASGLLYL